MVYDNEERTISHVPFTQSPIIFRFLSFVNDKGEEERYGGDHLLLLSHATEMPEHYKSVRVSAKELGWSTTTYIKKRNELCKPTVEMGVPLMVISKFRDSKNKERVLTECFPYQEEMARYYNKLFNPKTGRSERERWINQWELAKETKRKGSQVSRPDKQIFQTTEDGKMYFEESNESTVSANDTGTVSGNGTVTVSANGTVPYQQMEQRIMKERKIKNKTNESIKSPASPGHQTVPASDEAVLVSSIKEKKELPKDSASQQDNQNILFAKKVADYLTTTTSKTDYRGVLSCIEKYGIERVKTAMKVYRQELTKIDADPNREAIRNPGAYFHKLLSDNKAPENDDFAINKRTAEVNAKMHSNFLEPTKTYLKIRCGLISEELSYSVPIQTFNSQLDKFIAMCLRDQE